MSIPGFTAESSLYRPSGHYQAVTTRVGDVGEQRVISQIRVGGSVGRVGLGFSCDRTSCRCDGDSDCNDMFSTDVCGANAFCYLGWLTGEWVCICQR